MPAFVHILRPLINRRHAFDDSGGMAEDLVDHMRGNAEFPGGEGAPEIVDAPVDDTTGLVEYLLGLGKTADRCRAGCRG